MTHHPQDLDLLHEATKLGTKGCCIVGLFGTVMSVAALATLILTYDSSKQPGMGPDSAESRRRTMLHSRSELDAFVHRNAETAAAIQREKSNSSEQ